MGQGADPRPFALKKGHMRNERSSSNRKGHLPSRSSAMAIVLELLSENGVIKPSLIFIRPPNLSAFLTCHSTASSMKLGNFKTSEGQNQFAELEFITRWSRPHSTLPWVVPFPPITLLLEHGSRRRYRRSISHILAWWQCSGNPWDNLLSPITLCSIPGSAHPVVNIVHASCCNKQWRAVLLMSCSTFPSKESSYDSQCDPQGHMENGARFTIHHLLLLTKPPNHHKAPSILVEDCQTPSSMMGSALFSPIWTLSVLASLGLLVCMRNVKTTRLCR